MKNLSLFFLLAVSMIGGTVFADDEEGSPFNCVEKTAAVYSPSKNWKDLQKYFDGHLGFIMGSLKSGKLEEAGPFLDKDKQPEGGLLITPITDRKEAAELFKQDPFIANDVAQVTFRTWQNCKLKN